MRIDTHEENLGMQGLLKKLGYHFLWCHLFREQRQTLGV